MDDRCHKLPRLSLLEKALRQGLEMFVDTGTRVHEKALPSEVHRVTESKADPGADYGNDKNQCHGTTKGIEWLWEREWCRLTWVQVVKNLPDNLRGLKRSNGVRKRQHCDRNE